MILLVLLVQLFLNYSICQFGEVCFIFLFEKVFCYCYSIELPHCSLVLLCKVVPSVLNFRVVRQSKVCWVFKDVYVSRSISREKWVTLFLSS